MTSDNERTQGQDDTAGQPEENDTEGNIFAPDPTTSRELARIRDREVERAARERQRVKEARGR